LAEVHHFAPPFRPLAFLAAPRRPPFFVVPDFAPGDFRFCGFLRVTLRLLDPWRGSSDQAGRGCLMTRLPAVTARQLVAVAERIGFTFDRQKGFDPSRGVM
jgi:hypothetical protein